MLYSPVVILGDFQCSCCRNWIGPPVNPKATSSDMILRSSIGGPFQISQILCWQPYVTLVYSASVDAESYAENGTAAWTSYASRLNGAIIMTNFWTSTSYFLEIAPAVIWVWDVLGSPWFSGFRHALLIPSTEVLRHHQEDDSWSVEAADFWCTSVADIVGEFLRFDPCFGWLNHQPDLDSCSVQKATRSMIPIDFHSFELLKLAPATFA